MNLPVSFLVARSRLLLLVMLGFGFSLQLIHAADAQHGQDFANPDHLEPIPAYDPDGYNQAVFESLIGQRRPELWMIVKPSFSPEFAVLLFCHEESGTSSEPTKKWEVEVVGPKAQIWRWKEVDERTSVLDIHATDDLTVKTAPISAELAAKISAAWRAALLQTRYPKQDQSGVDGVTYEFYCDYNLFGQTWSPEGGVPFLLTELGSALVRIANQKEVQPSLDKCLALADQILALTAKAK